MQRRCGAVGRYNDVRHIVAEVFHYAPTHAGGVTEKGRDETEHMAPHFKLHIKNKTRSQHINQNRNMD